MKREKRNSLTRKGGKMEFVRGVQTTPTTSLFFTLWISLKLKIFYLSKKKKEPNSNGIIDTRGTEKGLYTIREGVKKNDEN